MGRKEELRFMKIPLQKSLISMVQRRIDLSAFYATKRMMMKGNVRQNGKLSGINTEITHRRHTGSVLHAELLVAQIFRRVRGVPEVTNSHILSKVWICIL